MGDAAVDGRRVRGDASRRLVLRAAMERSSLSGLGSISIAGVAEASGLSKGGVAALFGTKEQLQLATIEAARSVFVATVIRPALEVDGVARLRRVVDEWIDYSRGRTFAGGCFFATVGPEWSSQQGPVRDAVAAANREWTRFLTDAAERAARDGDLPADPGAPQLAFEITALLDGANTLSLLHHSDVPYDHARAAIDRLLTRPGRRPT